MSTRVGTVTLPDGRNLLDVYASTGGVELHWCLGEHEDLKSIDLVQARAFAALLEVAANTVERMRDRAAKEPR